VEQIYFGDLVDNPNAPYVPPNPEPGKTIYSNLEQTGRFICADGTIQTYTVPGGTNALFFGDTQEYADAAALAFAMETAKSLCTGQTAPVPPSPIPNPFPPDEVPPSPDDPNTTPNAPLTCLENFHNENGVCVPDPVNPTPPPNPPPPGQMYSNHAKSCTVPCKDGDPSAGSFTYTIRAGVYNSKNGQNYVDQQAYSEACRLAALNKICLSVLDTSACTFGCPCVNHEYFASITAAMPAADENKTAMWTLLPGSSLPPGLVLTAGPVPVLNQKSIANITGTPTTPGAYNFGVRVSDTLGNQQQRYYSIQIIGITTPSHLSNALLLDGYSKALLQFGFSTGTVVWRLESDSNRPEWTLPPGLALNSSTGIISGYPNALPKTYTFGVTIEKWKTDGSAVEYSCFKEFTLEVTGACLATVYLVPTPGLYQKDALVATYNYGDVTTSFTDTFGVVAAKSYMF
jgi:hypothetical protein